MQREIIISHHRSYCFFIQVFICTNKIVDLTGIRTSYFVDYIRVLSRANGPGCITSCFHPGFHLHQQNCRPLFLLVCLMPFSACMGSRRCLFLCACVLVHRCLILYYYRFLFLCTWVLVRRCLIVYYSRCLFSARMGTGASMPNSALVSMPFLVCKVKIFVSPT